MLVKEYPSWSPARLARLNPTFLLQKHLELIYNFSTKCSYDNSTNNQRHCRELDHTGQMCRTCYSYHAVRGW